MKTSDLGVLPERDRALVRVLVATVLRRLGTLRHLLAALLQRGLPSAAPKVESALLIGATQILFLDMPDHAAVDLSVRVVQAERTAARYTGLVNAVLRQASRAKAPDRLAALDTVALDTPDWLMQRWIARYGENTARAIALAHRHEPALDLTVKARCRRMGRPARRPCAADGVGAHGPARRRSASSTAIDDGAWWVQDAAAALPARLLGDRARAERRRSLRRARRQDRTACECGRPSHRGRPLDDHGWRGCARTSRGFRSRPKP